MTNDIMKTFPWLGRVEQYNNFYSIVYFQSQTYFLCESQQVTVTLLYSFRGRKDMIFFRKFFF